MPTVIDSLVVELGLDTSNFTKGQRDALAAMKKFKEDMASSLSQVEHNTRRTADASERSLKMMTSAASSLFTTIAGGSFVSLVKNSAAAGAEIGRMSANTGLATERLSAMGRVMERNGSSAQSAMGTFKAFGEAVSRFANFGEGGTDFQLFFSQMDLKQGDDAIASFMKFVDWAEQHKNDPALVNVMGQKGGLDQGLINLALKGRAQAIKEIGEASKGAVGDTEAMSRLQTSWVKIGQALTTVGMRMAEDIEPMFTRFANAVSGFTDNNQRLVTSLIEILAALTLLKSMSSLLSLFARLGGGGAAVAGAGGAAAGGFGLLAKRARGVAGLAVAGAIAMKQDSQTGNGVRSMLREALGIEDPGEAAPWDGAKPGGGSSGGGAFKDQAEKEAFIRESARKAGIDPDVAMRVARSEGFDNFRSTVRTKSGEQETSYGAFQLYVSPTGKANAVGDQFKKLTGLDPADPKNERETIMFAMEWVKRQKNWDDFHGAKNTGIGRKEGIGDINVTVQTASNDPKEHGRVVAEEIKRRVGSPQSIAAQANTGLN